MLFNLSSIISQSSSFCLRWKKGDWTDDTDQMLLILQMVCELNGEVDAKDFARRLLHWARHGIEELGDIGKERQ